jgi:hypothetical protein
MTSLSKLGRFARLSWLMDFGVMCLIVGGFMATAGTMFWSFTQVPERPAIQQTASDAPPDMICECTPGPAPSRVN